MDTNYADLPIMKKISHKSALWLLLNIMILAMGMISAWRWLNKDYAMIRFVRIQGSFQHIDRNQLKTVLMPLVDTGFLLLDVNQIKKEAGSLPWVDSVEVERVWPDTVTIRMVEQIPYIRWGSRSLLNQEGERFSPAIIEQFDNLPVIHASDGEEKRLYKAFKEMQQALKKHDLKVVSINVSDLKAWTVMLDNGMELKLGRRPLVMLDRFLRSVPWLRKQGLAAIQRVDMRYPNGYALSLKQNTEIQWNSL